MFTSPASIDRGKLKLADRRLEFQTPQRNLEDLRVDVGDEVSVQKAEMGLQDQILQMQMQMKMLVASLETSERARIAAEANRDASLKKLRQKKELEIKYAVAEESEEELGAAGSGSQVDESDEELDTAGSSSQVKKHSVATRLSHGKPEEHSVRKEDYQAALKDLEKIKKDGSNFERWQVQFARLAYVAKWNKKLFVLDCAAWDGVEEANEILRKDRVAAYMCLLRCIGNELDYLNSGVKLGDSNHLFKKIHVQFAKATEGRLRKAYNKFSESQMKQLPSWDSSQFAGEVVKAAEKIKTLGGHPPSMAQQREALLEGLLPKFDEFVRTMKMNTSFGHEWSFDDTVAKLREHEIELASKNRKVVNDDAFLGHSSDHNRGKALCRFFVKSGTCTKGNSCPFKHEAPRGGVMPKASAPAAPVVVKQDGASKNNNGIQNAQSKVSSKGKCFGCHSGESGHFKRDCPEKKSFHANVADAEVAVN